MAVNLTNATSDNTAETVNEGDSYAAAITADDGYTLSYVTVVMGGVDITNTSYAMGNIYIAAVTGDIVITAEAVEVVATMYSITNNLVNVTSDNAAVSVEENSAYSAVLTVADGYDLDSVTVTMGGVDVTADVYTDGVITIPAVTGDIVITAAGKKPNINISESNTYLTSTERTVAITTDDLQSLGVEHLYAVLYSSSAYSTTLGAKVYSSSAYSHKYLPDGWIDQDLSYSEVVQNDAYTHTRVKRIDIASVISAWQSMVDEGTIESTDKEIAFEVGANVKMWKLLYEYDATQSV